MSIFLDNLKNKNTDVVPVWFMRQAGRYMEEYHKVKNKFNNFMHMCKDVDAVTDITMQPINKFDLDSAIIFSDILILLECLDLKVDFVKGKGPIVRNEDFIKRISSIVIDRELNQLQPVYEAIKSVKKQLTKKKIPLLGFVGAPWTLAAYAIEGNLSKEHLKIRKFAYKETKLMDRLVDMLSELVIEHMSNQIEYGADAIQIFESHSNSMDYFLSEKYMIKKCIYITKKIKKRHPSVPLIFFSKTNNYLGFKSFFNNIDCVSFSSNYRMKNYLNAVPQNISFQGNLDPMKLVIGGNEMRTSVNSILEDMRKKNFIFNLGHGILPETPVENVCRIVDQIREFKKRV